MSLNPLLLVALLVPILAAVGIMVVMRMNRQNAALRRRIQSVTGSGQGVALLPRITRHGAGQKAGWKDRAASLFGFTLAKRSIYPVRWFWVVGGSLLIGRATVAMGLPVLGQVAWAAMPVVSIMLSRAIFGSFDNKRQLLLRSQLPDALGLIVRAVRVGIPVSEGLRAVAREAPAPTGGEFKQLSDQIAIGVLLDVALREMAVRNELPEYGFFAAAIGLQAQTGGGLTETLDLLADVTRKRVALRARGRALSAEARTSAIVLAALPVVLIGGFSLTSPEYIAPLFTTSQGNTLLGVAVIMLALGGLSMQTIIQKTLA